MKMTTTTDALDRPLPTSSDELMSIARDAVLFALPLYEMARMRSATCCRRDRAGRFAGDSPESTFRWANEWIHTRQLLGPQNREVVTPNNDTLYSSIWLDLTAGPLVLSVPDVGERYYVMGLLDFHTNPFGYIGSRTTGTSKGTFLLHGPDWQGETPPGMQALRCPTNAVWMIGRLLVDGPDDLARAVALQDQFVIAPLEGSRATTLSLIDAGLQPREHASDPVRFARVVNRALAENPPPSEAKHHVERFVACGIGPHCDADAMTQAQRDAVEVAIGQLREELAKPQPSALGGGWFLPVDIGDTFGTRYFERAQVALNYIGALGIEEAMYVIADCDSASQPLDGDTGYVLHFPAGGLPQTDAFWSLTAYDKVSCLLVENTAGRYSVGDRTPGMRYDGDGGLRIAISSQRPVDPVLQANWLPAPAGPFYLTLRLYEPRTAHLSREFQYPSVERKAPR
ncbi:DUF1254 domain-containing protein [Paraburkholderia caffeinilytica]|uniref:DUF1254 domain-containing protein n=1 Tax=Paraburkholderia caffeinilytica TaxID=1761016 RepID=UPI0038B74EDF